MYPLDQQTTSTLRARVATLIMGFLVMGFLVLIWIQGCAHTPHSSPQEANQQKLGRIGVVVKLTGEREALELPRTGGLDTQGLLEGIATGAGAGVSLGFLGIACGPGVVLCAPVLAGAGSVGGAIAGAMGGIKGSASGPQDDIVLSDMGFEEVVLSQTIAALREKDYDSDKFRTDAPHAEPDQSINPASVPDSVSTILEIRDPIVILALTGSLRRLVLSAQIRLIRAAEDQVVDVQMVTKEFGAPRSLAEWAADDAKLLREEVRLAAPQLALTISQQMFTLQGLSERKD